MPKGDQTQRTNPLRLPEVVQAIREFIITEGQGLPGKPSGPAILAMVASRFQIFAGPNQLAGMLGREGISRGGPSKTTMDASREAHLRRERVRHHRERQQMKERLKDGPQPVVAPDTARVHDIAQFMRANPARQQRHDRVPKETLGADHVQPAQIATPIPKASLRPRECSWPIGEPRTPSFRYCDVPHTNAGSYCDEHHRMAFVKMVRRAGRG